MVFIVSEKHITALERKRVACNAPSFFNTPLEPVFQDLSIYRVAQKKLAHFLSYALTSSNIDRFSNLFRCQNQENICNNIVTKDPTTPQVCRYTTLWNVGVLKVTIENKKTSVTTHLKSASSSSEADTCNIWCKNCRMRQLLSIITETINALFPVVNCLR